LFTSFENDELLQNITASPNPFSTETTLQINQNLKSATLTVYNLLGQAVKQINGLTVAAGQTIVLPRENLPAGQYFVAILAQGKLVGRKKILIF
jgi:Secretion system C-terminal sorting domain